MLIQFDPEGERFMMRYHVSDKAKRAAEVWKNACCLYHILQIDLERFPKGNVIMKNSRQKRILRDGLEKTYFYHYENVDVYGGDQFHLPLKRKWKPKEKLWDLRSKVIYRIGVENRVESLRKQVETQIKDLNVFKGSKEAPGTFEEILRLAGQAMGHQERYEEYRMRARRRLLGKEAKSFGEDVRIITDLGESVRSKNECLFANKLREMGIPYLYEVLLENEVAPDFTVFIGETVYFIELLGMMDRQDYRERLAEKLEIYKRMKILPGERLVLIDMTKGLDMRRLEKILRGLFVGEVSAEVLPGA